MPLVGIGIKATPKEIFYTIIENHEDELVIISLQKLVIPVFLDTPEKLSFIRKSFKDILFEYKCTVAGIRVTEDIGTPDIRRVSYEAVIQELLASSTVEKYLIGKISTMYPRLGIGKRDYKKIITNELSFDLIKEFERYSKDFKEAILVCIASFTL